MLLPDKNRRLIFCEDLDFLRNCNNFNKVNLINIILYRYEKYLYFLNDYKSAIICDYI